MAALMRAAARSVKSFRRHDAAATMPGIILNAPDFSRVGARICKLPPKPMNPLMRWDD